MEEFGPTVNWLINFKYAVILPLSTAEGPIISIIVGFLLKLKYLSFWPAYIALMAGDLIGDVLWYYVGRHGARRALKRWGHFIHLDEKAMQIVEAKFRKHQNKTLLISKMTNGFGFALVTLVVAGALKIDFKKYMIINAIGGFVWIGLLLALGYFFGHLYTVIDKAFRLGFIAVVIVFVVVVLYGLQRYFKQATLKGKL